LLASLLKLEPLPVRFLSSDNGTGDEKGASRSSSLAHIMLILERFSRVTGVVRLAPLAAILLSENAEEELEELETEAGDVFLRRSTGFTGMSSSGHLGRRAAPMIL
jgi:ribulose-5-phosphate 4-epimerase/fuculose-1-phosphate aldolase